MTAFPLSEDKWYASRDDRTRRVDGANGFEDFAVGVVMGSRIQSVHSIQVMALVTISILARWCRKVRVDIPSTVPSRLPIHLGRNFTDIISREMLNANPYGEFTFGEVKCDDYDQILIIGETEKVFEKECVWIDAAGWVAGVGYGNRRVSLQSHQNDNPIGSVFASCLGNAELFRQAVGLPVPNPYSTWYSLYDFSRSLENPSMLNNPKYTSEFDFGRIHQIGCGAVGSSLDFLLALTSWKANIDLIDYDIVDLTTCNRSPTFGAYEALAERRKIDVCADVLSPTKITPSIFEGDYSQFIMKGRFLDAPPDLILCLANERNVWSNVQHNYPPMVFHATTTPNWGVNFGRHIPKKEWCILCRFSKEIEHEFIPTCSEVVMRSEDKQDKPINGVLPFLSTTTATLVLAEMAKIPLNDYPITKNFVEFSTKSPEGVFIQIQRKAEPDCVCQTQPISHYPGEIKRSRFWRLVGQQTAIDLAGAKIL